MSEVALGAGQGGGPLSSTIIIKAPLGFQQPEAGRGDGKPG